MQFLKVYSICAGKLLGSMNKPLRLSRQVKPQESPCSLSKWYDYLATKKG